MWREISGMKWIKCRLYFTKNSRGIENWRLGELDRDHGGI